MVAAPLNQILKQILQKLATFEQTESIIDYYWYKNPVQKSSQLEG